MAKQWLGCSECKTFTKLNESTMGWICQGCKKYVRRDDALKESDMKESSKRVNSTPGHASSGAKKLYKEMENKTDKWIGDVSAGKLPYTDPNTGKKVQ